MSPVMVNFAIHVIRILLADDAVMMQLTQSLNDSMFWVPPPWTAS